MGESRPIAGGRPPEVARATADLLSQARQLRFHDGELAAELLDLMLLGQNESFDSDWSRQLVRF